MQVEHRSIKKGETLEDTARTLNAMRPDALVIRHGDERRAADVAAIMDCPVINAGDGIGRASDPGAARRRDDPPSFRPDRGTQGRDLRRHSATAASRDRMPSSCPGSAPKSGFAGPPSLVPDGVRRQHLLTMQSTVQMSS